MARMNSRNRRKFYDLIVARDGGAFCFIGGEPLTFETAVIDHLNNLNNDNRLDNLHLFCKSMNCVKNSRGRDDRHRVLSPMSGKIYTQMCENEQVRTNSIEIIRNMVSEPNALHFIFWRMIRDGKILLEDALDGAASFARCSQETVRRYLKKELSELRLYMLREDPETGKKVIQFKPEWAIFREKLEDREKQKKVIRNWEEIMNEEAFGSLPSKNKRDN